MNHSGCIGVLSYPTSPVIRGPSVLCKGHIVLSGMRALLIENGRGQGEGENLPEGWLKLDVPCGFVKSSDGLIVLRTPSVPFSPMLSIRLLAFCWKAKTQSFVHCASLKTRFLASVLMPRIFK